MSKILLHKFSDIFKNNILPLTAKGVDIGNKIFGAAIINKNSTLWNVSAEEFSKVIDINIKGVHNTIKEFVPDMIKAGKGTVVNFSSGWGRSASPEVAPYCSSKWAIEGFLESLRFEVASFGIRVINIEPGLFKTKILTDNLKTSVGMSDDKSPYFSFTEINPVVFILIWVGIS